MPTYKELVELPDDELKRCIGIALNQLDKAEEQDETTTEKTKIYMVYNNELAKRNYRQSFHLHLIETSPTSPKPIDTAQPAAH